MTKENEIPVNSEGGLAIETLLPINKDLLRGLRDNLRAEEERAVAFDEATWEKLPDDLRKAITAYLFRVLVQHAKEGGSFRYLIYERLGFGADAYMPLYLAGGMTISNEFALTEVSEEDDAIVSELKALAREEKDESRRMLLFRALWRIEELMHAMREAQGRRERLETEMRDLVGLLDHFQGPHRQDTGASEVESMPGPSDKAIVKMSDFRTEEDPFTGELLYFQRYPADDIGKT